MVKAGFFIKFKTTVNVDNHELRKYAYCNDEAVRYKTKSAAKNIMLDELKHISTEWRCMLEEKEAIKPNKVGRFETYFYDYEFQLPAIEDSKVLGLLKNLQIKFRQHSIRFQPYLLSYKGGKVIQEKRLTI